MRNGQIPEHGDRPAENTDKSPGAMNPLHTIIIIAGAAMVIGWIATDLLFTAAGLLGWAETEARENEATRYLIAQGGTMMVAISGTIGIVIVGGVYTPLRTPMLRQGDRMSTYTLQPNAAGAALGVTLQRLFQTADQEMATVLPVILTGAALGAIELLILHTIARTVPQEDGKENP